jgi:23S rRNA (guanine745-N1)-methyltransferase
MLDAWVPFLRCPVCLENGLRQTPSAVTCQNGHTFNRARQGYIDMLPSSPRGRHSGDSLHMIDARARFLGSGVYGPIADEIGHQAVGPVVADRVNDSQVYLELGGGTGYYLDAALAAAEKAGSRAVGMLADVSMYAARHAARARPDWVVLRTDVWRDFPVATGTVSVCLVVFAPRNAVETARVLIAGGTLIVVTPGDHHLGEMVSITGGIGVEPNKQERLFTAMTSHLAHRNSVSLTYESGLSAGQALDVVGMGPSARHMDMATVRSAIEARIPPIPVTVDVRIDVFVAN